jgi:hypothetical protein
MEGLSHTEYVEVVAGEFQRCCSAQSRGRDANHES